MPHCTVTAASRILARRLLCGGKRGPFTVAFGWAAGREGIMVALRRCVKHQGGGWQAETVAIVTVVTAA